MALVVIRGELDQYTLGSVRAALADLSLAAVVLALALTALDYIALLGYDLLGLRYAGQKLPIRQVALASTTGYAFSQALGFPLLTGAPIRYRLYSSWGLDGLDVAKVVAFCVVTYWLGFFAFGGAVLFLSPLELPMGLGLPDRLARLPGAVLLLVSAGYVLACLRIRRRLRFRRAEFALPSGRIAALQIGVSSAEWLASASVLAALLPAELGLGVGETMSLFVIAHAAGLVSHVPGGVGVFEAVILWYLPSGITDPAVLGALVAYRVIFYLVPLLVGAVLLAISEVRANREAMEELATTTVAAVSSVAPRVISALTFVTGTILVLGGTLPLAAGTRTWLTRVMPLPVFELSHFGASLVGAALLVLARGLQRRLDGAYQVTVVLVSIGTVSAAVRGLSAWELVPITALLGVLLVSRREFHREASLLRESFTSGWVVAIGLVLVTSIWLGAFAYQRVEYSSQMWWTFAFGGNAPRFLRSTVGVTAVLGLFAVARLLRPAPAVHTAPDPSVLKLLEPIVASAPRVTAHLALVGDKQILFSRSGRSFIMYGIEGDSWIAMGDPVGDPAEFRGLAWRFRELADQAGDAIVFYQATADHLPIYIELGLNVLKIGEEAFVDLASFTFEGSRRADLRKALRRIEAAGGSFAIVDTHDVRPLLHDIASISDQWLEKWNVTEKGFSMGRFHEDYLLRNPVAVVRVEGEPVAFGNVWAVGRHEISYDLIRYRPDAPKSTMDYLFAQLIVWGREQGFERMSLGMAPLAGLDSERLSPLWNRLGAAVFRHGGHFYNFRGLHDYKQKFDPMWEARYLASPAGFALPGVLTDVASLIAGGLVGIVRR